MERLLFLGDSITDANHFFSDNPLGDGFVSLIGNQLSSTQYQLYNRGHDGFTIEQLLRMVSRDGIANVWDMITILIGVNDIPVEVYTNQNRIPYEYETYYRQLLTYVRRHSNARLILIEPFLFEQPAIYKSWQTYLQMESQIIQKLAREYNADFIPTKQALQDACLKWGTAAITLDGIHLTDLGNQLLANLWLAALGDVL